MSDALTPLISVIVPIRNGANTVARALDSIQSQTFQNWEALIVDDGSTDNTADVVKVYAEKDKRFHLIQQSGAGVSAARNTGIKNAQGEWLAFLDGDDTLDTQHMQCLLEALKQTPDAALAYGNWAYVSHEGVSGDYPFYDGHVGFEEMGRRCAFAIFCCLVKAQWVREVGGFDTALVTCEDWDLWQRIARTGKPFVSVPKVVAYYQLRLGSSSKDAARLLEDSWVVLKRGYEADSRVNEPDPRYAQGLQTDDCELMHWYLAIFSAGMLIGKGESLLPVLDKLDEKGPFLYGPSVAASLFSSVPLARAQVLSEWTSFFDETYQPMFDFILELEKRTKTRGLAKSSLDYLKRMLIDQAHELPLSVDNVYGVAVDVFKEIPDFKLSPEMERLVCKISFQNKALTTIELPICDGFVPAEVIQDTIAHTYAWDLLKSYLAQTVYRTLRIEETASGWQVSRDKVMWNFCERPDEDALHNTVGWTVLLQELFNYPQGNDHAFYKPQLRLGRAITQKVVGDIVRVELSQPIPDLIVETESATVLVTLGGKVVGGLELKANKGKILSGYMRTEILQALGFELCALMVRESIIGQPISQHPLSLRERLQLKYKNRLNTKAQNPIRPFQQGVVVTRRLLDLGLPTVNQTYRLPAAVVNELRRVSENASEGLVYFGDPSQAQSVAYVPHELSESLAPSLQVDHLRPCGDKNDRAYNRQYFEALYNSGEDPWRYTSEYEQVKYQQTLDILPNKKWKRILELGCAEGVFTEMLAPHGSQIMATDVSQVALKRAAERCQSFPQIQFKHLDIATGNIPQQQDLIVCSEILYYTGNHHALKDALKRMSESLNKEGYLVMAHSNLAWEEFSHMGFNWDVPFGSKGISKAARGTDGLVLVKQFKTPLYRIQLYQKQSAGWFSWKRYAPSQTIHSERMGKMTDEAAQGVIQSKQFASAGKTEASTAQLPILMYHRVAPEGTEALRRYRVTPEQLEAQLKYLKENGYQGVTLEQWGEAQRIRKPLPGHAVCLTFDDGYQDFHDYAWPLLKKYGFPATVFLVADAIGENNGWDEDYQDNVALMDWETIVSLQAEGVHFGSHSATHPAMTALNPTQIAKELLASRYILEEGLTRPVRTFCYPYGSVDSVVEHLTGACGFVYGVTVVDRLAALHDSPLMLPRVEVNGLHDLDTFIKRLSPA